MDQMPWWTFWTGPNVLQGDEQEETAPGKGRWVLQSECCLPHRKKDLEAQGKDMNRCHSDVELTKFGQKSTLLR